MSERSKRIESNESENEDIADRIFKRLDNLTEEEWDKAMREAKAMEQSRNEQMYARIKKERDARNGNSAPPEAS